MFPYTLGDYIAAAFYAVILLTFFGSIILGSIGAARSIEKRYPNHKFFEPTGLEDEDDEEYGDYDRR
ncbi:hypothetical protein [uncultured Halomonas sp.]|uniref:hypothetical protein n=1 Tax=uncultured Halomonas sp. TaxID=173971 RepID=UPI00260B1C9C|nr:hypothetical protein [uncultured Halomonas sp.]